MSRSDEKYDPWGQEWDQPSEREQAYYRDLDRRVADQLGCLPAHYCEVCGSDLAKRATCPACGDDE